jgi:hypothetical protein
MTTRTYSRPGSAPLRFAFALWLVLSGINGGFALTALADGESVRAAYLFAITALCANTVFLIHLLLRCSEPSS